MVSSGGRGGFQAPERFDGAIEGFPIGGRGGVGAVGRAQTLNKFIDERVDVGGGGAEVIEGKERHGFKPGRCEERKRKRKFE